MRSSFSVEFVMKMVSHQRLVMNETSEDYQKYLQANYRPEKKKMQVLPVEGIFKSVRNDLYVFP